MKYEVWLEDFLKNKSEVPRPKEEENDELYRDIHRFQDLNGDFWEYAKTYTGRLLIRSGKSVSGVLIWNSWKTLHHIDLQD